MRCVQVLSLLAVKLCIWQPANRTGWTDVAESFGQYDHHVARALRQANARAWLAVEVLLAGEAVWERAQLGWERSLEAEFFRPLRLLLDEVSLAPLDETGPDARRKAHQSLQAALASGLLTSGTLDLSELFLLLDEPDAPQEEWAGAWRSLAQWTGQLEQAGYPELRPLFHLRCATGEPFLVSLVATLFRHALESDPDLFGSLAETLIDNPAEGVLADLRGLAVVLDLHRARLHALLSSLYDADSSATPAALPVVDRQGGANRLDRGISSMQRGEYDRAIAEFTAALQLDPDLGQGFLLRADAHRLKGDYAQAVTDYSAVLRHEPTNIQALLQRGQLHLVLGQVQEAIGDFTAVLQNDPKNAVAYHARGKALHAAGDHDGAIVNLSEALRIDPYFAWAHHDSGEAHAAKGNLERALADYSEAIRLNPLTTLTYLRRGDVHAALNDYDRAIADYGNALRLDAHNPAIYLARGVAYRNQAKFDLAGADLTRALELDFANARLYHERGVLFLLQGNHQRALVDFNTAIGREPNEADNYFRRGLAYQGLGKVKTALADFTQAIRLDSSHGEAYLNRGLLYAARAEHDLALPDYNEAIDLGAGGAAAYLHRAKALVALGHNKHALADCDEALRLEPEMLHGYFVRGSLFAQNGEYARAIEDFSRGLRGEGASAQGFYLRGLAYLKLENYRQAVLDLTEAIRLDPNHARAYAQRAAIRQAAGMPDQALLDLAHAVRLDGQLAPAFCRQLAVVHSALGLYECAVADYTLALLLDPNNAAAQAGREQAWKNYQTQPRKKPATGKVQQLGGKFPLLLEKSAGTTAPPPAVAPEGASATEPARANKKTLTHRAQVETGEIPALDTANALESLRDLAGDDNSQAEDEDASEPEVEIEILDDEPASPEQADDPNVTSRPEPEQEKEEYVDPEEVARKARQDAEHRARLMEQFRQAEEEKKKKLAAKAEPAKKEKARTYDDDDDDGVPKWKKDLIAAASIFLLYIVGSTAWGFIDEAARTGKPRTYALSGKLLSASGDMPLGKVEVTFAPKEVGRGLPSQPVITSDDGSFKVRTFAPGDGLVAGTYVMTLEPSPLCRVPVSPEYLSWKTSPITVEVTSSTPSEVHTFKIK